MKRLLAALFPGILGVLACLAMLLIVQVRNRPDLSIWHLAQLDAEYSAENQSQIVDFTGYLSQEERLFQQLEKEVYRQVPDKQRGNFNRYHTGAWSDSSLQALHQTASGQEA